MSYYFWLGVSGHTQPLPNLPRLTRGPFPFGGLGGIPMKKVIQIERLVNF